MLALNNRPNFTLTAKILTSRNGKAKESNITMDMKFIEQTKAKYTTLKFGNSKNWFLDGILDAGNKKRNKSPSPPNVTYSTDNDENTPIQRKTSTPDLSIPINNSVSLDRHQTVKSYNLYLLKMMAEI